MVGNVEFKVYGPTLAALVEAATAQWREFIGDEAVDLPRDAELRVAEHAAHEYVGTVIVRTRL